MKLHSRFHRATVTALGMLPFLAVPALVSPAYAGPPSIVREANRAATISVTVPPGSKPVTYMLGNKKWTVQPGQTAVLPASATRIYLPVGTIITVLVPSEKSMEPTKHAYTVDQPVELPALTPVAIRASEQSITPGAQLPVPGGGTIQLPSGTIVDLVNAAAGSGSTALNPHNVLGEGVTDGN